LSRSPWWTAPTLGALAACGGGASPESYAHDPCEPIAIVATAATGAQRDGVAAAIALWHGRGVAAFDPPADTGAAPVAPPSLEVRFDDAAPAFHGVYDPAADRVLINRGIGDAPTLAIVVAHELGHAFGLAHVAPAARISLMNPDNLTTPPTDADQRELEARWGACR